MTAQVERDDIGWQWFCGNCGDWSLYYAFECDAVTDAGEHDARWHEAGEGDPDTYYEAWREGDR